MLNNASKAIFGIAGAAAVFFVAYALFVGGDRGANALLLALVAAAAAVGVVAASAGVIDRAPRVEADAGAPQRRPAEAPGPASRPSLGPVLLAAGVAFVAVAGAAGARWALIAVGLGAAGLVGWGLQLWTEHPSYSPAVGRRLSSRWLAPLGIPLAAVAVAAVVVISVSRSLLTSSEKGAVVVAIVVAVVLFTGCAFVALGRRISGRVVGALAAVAVVAAVGAGSASAARGERTFDKHTDPTPTVRVAAQNLAYDKKSITVPEGRVKLTFVNNDAAVYHDVAIYSDKSGGKPYFATTPFAGVARETQTFQTPAAGTYTFRCDFHPGMVGTFVVTPAAAGPAASTP